MNNWYLIYTPQLHGLTALLLVQEAFDVRKIKARLWLPMQKVKQMKYKKEVEVQVPMFPNYVFVQTAFPKGAEQEMEQMLRELKAGFFLKEVGSDLPARILEEEIQRIEEKEKEEVQATKKEESYTPIEIGTYVEVAASPLMGLKGIVVETSRDTVTIETFVFGRSAPVEVPISVLSRSTPVSAPSSSKN